MSGRVERKRVLITAAAAGIGRASALALAREGARVVATDVDEAGLSALRAQDARIECARLDVRDTQAVEELVARLGPFEVLFNCAGFVHHGTLLECPESDWERSFDLNVKSMYRTIRACLPGMLAARRGSIINMSSVA